MDGQPDTGRSTAGMDEAHHVLALAFAMGRRWQLSHTRQMAEILEANQLKPHNFAWGIVRSVQSIAILHKFENTCFNAE